MNAFQKRCSQAIGRTLSRHDMKLHFVEQPATAPSDDGAAMFLRGDLVHESRHYKIFVYSDGAGANVGHNWYVLQPRDCPSPDDLIETFCRFIDKCLEGQHPVAALKGARHSGPSDD